MPILTNNMGLKKPTNNEPADIDILNENLDKLDVHTHDALYVVSTMAAASWSNNQYSFEATYPHTLYDIEISVDNSATADQAKVFGAALICGSATSNVVTAAGSAPAVDIPIIIKAVKKNNGGNS